MQEAGILASSHGRTADARLTVREAMEQQIRAVEAGRDGDAPALVGTLGTRGETTREGGQPRTVPPTLSRGDG